jgi:hypothetical protein
VVAEIVVTSAFRSFDRLWLWVPDLRSRRAAGAALARLSGTTAVVLPKSTVDRPENTASHSRGANSVRVLRIDRPRYRRGRRECRVKASPMARQQIKKLAAVTTGSAGSSRHSLHDGFTAYSALSSGPGLSCPRRPQDHPARLTPASGCQDHTPLPSVPGSFVGARRCDRARPPHPALNVRDDREAPLERVQDGANDAVICGWRQVCFCKSEHVSCGKLARRAVCAWLACMRCARLLR